MLRISKIITVLAVIGLLAGCKVAVVVPSGGEVTSASGNRNCAGGSLCEFNVTDRTFSESFTAVAKPGYRFLKWKSGRGFLCGDSKDPTCVVDNSGTPQGNAIIDKFIAGDRFFYAMPLFEYVEPHPVGNSGKIAKETVGERQRLGPFGQAITRARYP